MYVANEAKILSQVFLEMNKEHKKNPDDEGTVTLRFHAGPPYEDVAFKIVNQEWKTPARWAVGVLRGVSGVKGPELASSACG